MSIRSIVPRVTELVEEACRRDTNLFGYGIWSHHIVVVRAFALQLADRLGADAEIVELAALLHDYASVKDYSLYADHHRHGAREAHGILEKLGYPAEKLRRVQECILHHRGSTALPASNMEAVCLASADAMAHIDQAPSLLYLAYVVKRMGVDEGAGWVRSKIERSWMKMCPEARQMMRFRYACIRATLGNPSSDDPCALS